MFKMTVSNGLGRFLFAFVDTKFVLVHERAATSYKIVRVLKSCT